jgi:hypothetical protein
MYRFGVFFGYPDETGYLAEFQIQEICISNSVKLGLILEHITNFSQCLILSINHRSADILITARLLQLDVTSLGALKIFLRVEKK